VSSTIRRVNGLGWASSIEDSERCGAPVLADRWRGAAGHGVPGKVRAAPQIPAREV